MSTKKGHSALVRLLAYLKGELSMQDRHAFEKEQQADPFETEAMEGLEQLSQEELEADLLELQGRLQGKLHGVTQNWKPERRQRRLFPAIAAAASLLIVASLFLHLYDFKPSSEEMLPVEEQAVKSPETMKEDAGLFDEPSPEREKGSVEKVGAEAAVEPRAEIPVEAQAKAKVETQTDAQIVQAPAAKAEVVKKASSDREPIQIPEPIQSPEAVNAPEPDRIGPEGKGEQELTGTIKGEVIDQPVQEELPKQDIRSRKASQQKNDGVYLVSDEKEMASEAKPFATDSGEKQAEEAVQILRQAPGQEDASLDEVIYLDEEELTPATPIGGSEAYEEYLLKEMTFPEEETERKRAIVELEFQVSSEGVIQDLNITRSDGEVFSREAIRLIQDGPHWKPAMLNREAVEDTVWIRMVFRK